MRLFTVIQFVVGFSTAGPFFFLSRTLFLQGDFVQSALLAILGVAVFLIIVLVVQIVYKRTIRMKNTLHERFHALLSRFVPAFIKKFI